MSWSGLYRGVVRSTSDPAQLGRVRLQVAQVTGTALTAWVPPAQSGGALPGVGEQVWVLYEGGDASYPTYIPPIAPAPISLVQDWTPVTLASGFTPNGNSNGTPEFRVMDILGSRQVEWRGGINISYEAGSIALGGLFLAEQMNFKPSTRRTVDAACSAASSAVNCLKIDFQANGDAGIVGTNTTTNQPPWVSLNDVSYYL